MGPAELSEVALNGLYPRRGIEIPIDHEDTAVGKGRGSPDHYASTVHLHSVGELHGIAESIPPAEYLRSREGGRRAADLGSSYVSSSVDIRIDDLPITDVRRSDSAVGDRILASPVAAPPVKPPEVLTAVMSPVPHCPPRRRNRQASLILSN